MSGATQLVLVRHGETAWNAEGRVQGQTDVPLNARGQAQAAALVPVLSAGSFSAAYSSDLERVKATAAPSLAALGLEAKLDARLRERHYGIFETLTYVECGQRHPVAFERFRAKDPSFDFEGGERLDRFFARSLEVLREIASAHPGENVLVFTHGGVLEMLYRDAHARGLSTPREFEIPNAAINRFSWSAGAWQMRQWADTAHLEAALDDLPD